MPQTIALRSLLGGFATLTPTSIVFFTDQVLAAGANAVATLPRVGFTLVWAFIKWKTVGTAMATSIPRFADNAALTTNLSNGTAFNFSQIAVLNTSQGFFVISDSALSAFFGIFNTGTLTGTFTFDARYEFYPIQ